jgi:hypothetical protein
VQKDRRQLHINRLNRRPCPFLPCLGQSGEKDPTYIASSRMQAIPGAPNKRIF